MDPTAYFQKIRAQQAAIPDTFPVVASLATADGGKEGILSEVPRSVAAKMIVEGAARLTTEQEARHFRAAQADAKKKADQLAAASRVQLSVVPTADLERLRSAAGSKKAE